MFKLHYVYMSFKFMKVSSFRISYFMFPRWFQMRYVCYAMIHGIFMFMHLMLFTKRITYVFEKNLGSQSEEPWKKVTRKKLVWWPKGLMMFCRQARPHVLYIKFRYSSVCTRRLYFTILMMFLKVFVSL